MKLSKRFVILLVLLVNSCSSYKVSDYPLFIRLPGSRECFEVKALSGEEKRYDVETCDKMVARSVMFTSESWKLLRGDIQRNCQMNQCDQIRGAADGLFLTIDQVLQKVPGF